MAAIVSVAITAVEHLKVDSHGIANLQSRRRRVYIRTPHPEIGMLFTEDLSHLNPHIRPGIGKGMGDPDRPRIKRIERYARGFEHRLLVINDRVVAACRRDPPQVIGDGHKVVRRVAWCTGAAQGYLEDAVRLGVDAYISGEISEQTVHLARESGVAYIAAGHHATERYGIQALGEHLATRFELKHQFIDIPNPV
jgi:hypothetical protein